MDVPRPEFARSKRRRRWFLTSLLALLLVSGWIALRQLHPARATADIHSLWIDTVRQGDLKREIRGHGVLVPEEIRWLPTLNAGRIERILAWPGTEVKADSVLVELSNPEVLQAQREAEWALATAEAEQSNLRVQLETQRLNQEAALASARANFNTARMDADVNTTLAKDGLIPDLILRQSQLKAEEMQKLLAVEEQRLLINGQAVEAQLAVARAKIEQLRAQLELKRQAVQALQIRAGMDGVLQQLGPDQMPLRVGQQLAAGANVARVADPSRLKAEIRIPETQVKDVRLGQTVRVDTRNGEVTGTVSRLDPAVVNGTVTVDATLTGPLPPGARPDLSIDGTIELEQLHGVLHVGRPAQARENTTLSLFRLTPDGQTALRIQARFGRGSNRAIEVVEGLAEGERIILSDMSRWDDYDQLNLR